MRKLLLSRMMLLLCALMAGGGSAWAQSWVKTDISSLSNGDVVVVLETAKYNRALLNTEATSSGSVKASSEVTLSADGTTITSTVDANIQWVFGGSSTSFTLKSNDDAKRQLWCRDNNDALRVKASSPGDAYVGTFTWDSDYKMMQSTSYTRYVGVWNNSGDYQWRAYNSQTGTNIKGCETSFYKYTSSDKTSTTTTINSAGITNTDLYLGASAGQLTATVTAGETTLSNATVTWSSSKPEFATIDNNGNVTLIAEGKTVITASYAGDDTYNSSSATYELTVEDNDPNILTATFEWGANEYSWTSTSDSNTYYDGSDYDAKEGNITIGFSGKVRLWKSGSSYTMRFYTDETYGRGTMILTADEGYAITAVSITGTTLSFQNPSSGTITGGEWTGLTKELTIEKGTSTSNFTTVEVTYKRAISINAACTDGTNYYGTFYTDEAYVMPEGVEGQTVVVNNGVLTVNTAYAAGATVPAETALLLKATSAGDKVIALSSGGTAPESNDLKGTLTAEETTSGNNCLFYRLTMHNGTDIGFWWGAANGGAFIPGAHKAYLAVSTNTARQGFSLFGDDASGIGATLVNSEERIVNVYDLQGRRVESSIFNSQSSILKKGLYIVNGKKIVIK